MIEFITREEGPFTVGEYDYENLYMKTGYAFAHVQIIPQVAYLHLYMQRYGAGVLRQLKGDFGCFKELMKHKGLRWICGTHGLEGAEKWEKFLRTLGFTWFTTTVTPEGVPCRFSRMEV